MRILRLIYLTIIQLVKQALSLRQSVAHAASRRQQRIIIKELEVERLDRITNPAKYLGK